MTLYYVYIFRCGDHYKIGYTGNVRTRLSSVNTASPVDVALIDFYSFRSRLTARNFEKDMHKRFADKRLRNSLTGELKEWFSLTPLEVAGIGVIARQISEGIKPVPERLQEAFAWSEVLKQRRLNATTLQD